MTKIVSHTAKTFRKH